MKLKKFCHLEVKFAVFWHQKPPWIFVVVVVVVVVVWSIFFFLGGGQNVLLAEIRNIAEKDIAW